jgi:hypothetical protein
MVVPAKIHAGTTYVPIWYVMHLLQHMGIHSTWAKDTWTFSAPDTIPQQLANLSPGQGTMSIQMDGHTLQNLTGMVGIDPYTKKQTTYMPIWYVMKVLQRMSIDSAWNGHVWALDSQI